MLVLLLHCTGWSGKCTYVSHLYSFWIIFYTPTCLTGLIQQRWARTLAIWVGNKKFTYSNHVVVHSHACILVHGPWDAARPAAMWASLFKRDKEGMGDGVAVSSVAITVIVNEAKGSIVERDISCGSSISFFNR
jgi:hypothetical protein